MIKIDPLSQFSIKKIVPFALGGVDLSFTNAALSLVVSVLIISGLLIFSLKQQKLVPNRTQALAELLLNFLGKLVGSYVGQEGIKYTPFIFCIFFLVLGGNLFGLLPQAYTFTSQIIVTFTLACIVFFSITIIGLAKHGLHFFRLFFPQGTPLYIAPLLIPVEIISYFSRPISLSVRLFANMVAGHVMLKIFATFAAILASTVWLSPGFILPTVINVGLFSFELLVALLQAYVFTVLTCIYLNDTLNFH
jgi:F-type H+-transporting ATPase subunit a